MTPISYFDNQCLVNFCKNLCYSKNMVFKATSIFLPLLLFVGVASSYIVGSDEEGTILRPFVSNSQKRRICVELCLSGLGGTPCGDECADITPLDLPVQSKQINNTARSVVNNITRDTSCSVLCSNNLGHPLCVCDAVSENVLKKSDDADFLQICSFFCVNYDYRIRGCQICSVYKTSFSSNRDGKLSMFFTKFETTVDWQTWCVEQCAKGNGGAACNCDRLPLK